MVPAWSRTMPVAWGRAATVVEREGGRMTRVLRLVFRVAVCGLAVWLCACVVLAAIVYRTGTIDEARDADVIIVLGAALKSDGRPNKALSRRSRHAAALWKAGHAASIICTGGVGPGLARSEADGCREVATGAGVPAGAKRPAQM